MDLNEVETLARPNGPAELPPWQDGDAPLAGGTWLFSEPQPGLRRLVDLSRLGWDGLDADAEGLRIGAMCPLARLAAFEASPALSSPPALSPPAWQAAPLLRQCCDALVASFKVQALATVGGNLCLALPAGSMAPLAAALGATCWLRAADGTERQLPAADFTLGVRRTALRPGELLRAVTIPAAALARRTAFRRIALSPLGRTGSLVIATLGTAGFGVTIAGALPRPRTLAFDAVPDAPALAAAVDQAGPWHDDVHGAPDWRRHVTRVLAEEVRQELANPCA